MARTVAELPNGSRITDYISLGVLNTMIPRTAVNAALEASSRQSIRQRDLPAHVMVYYVVALALYMQSSYREVLRCLLEGLQWLSDPSARPRVVGKSGISQARTRLGAEPLQALGQRAKTDAVDARVLAQMGTALHLRPTEASPPTHRALEELQVARDALVTDRTAARNRQKHLRHRLLKQQSKTRLSQIDRHLAAVDAAIGKRLAEDVGLARRTEILTSIPGVSSITAAGLLTRMPELGRLDAKAVASLAGLAPVTRQSGAWQGRSFIQGGRPRVRRLLYMPALAAARCNPDLRAKYRQLRGQGKPPKVALTAVMRKLLLLANALLEQNRSWLPDRPRRGSEAAPAGSAPFVAA